MFNFIYIIFQDLNTLNKCVSGMILALKIRFLTVRNNSIIMHSGRVYYIYYLFCVLVTGNYSYHRILLIYLRLSHTDPRTTATPHAYWRSLSTAPAILNNSFQFVCCCRSGKFRGCHRLIYQLFVFVFGRSSQLPDVLLQKNIFIVFDRSILANCGVGVINVSDDSTTKLRLRRKMKLQK